MAGSTRAREMAANIDAANEETIQTVIACPNARWQAVVPSDGRTFNVVASHIAGSYPSFAAFVQSVSNGGALPPVTMDMIDQGAAAHAKEAANVGKDAVLQSLRENGQALSAAVGSLSDEQLETPSANQMFGQTWTV